MVNKCCVPNCRGNYDGHSRVKVFKFPADEELKRKWLRAIGRQDFEPSKNSVVCHLHFEECDIRTHTVVQCANGQVHSMPLIYSRLNPGAVPSVRARNYCKAARRSRGKKPKVGNTSLPATQGYQLGRIGNCREIACLLREKIRTHQYLRVAMPRKAKSNLSRHTTRNRATRARANRVRKESQERRQHNAENQAAKRLREDSSERQERLAKQVQRQNQLRARETKARRQARLLEQAIRQKELRVRKNTQQRQLRLQEQTAWQERAKNEETSAHREVRVKEEFTVDDETWKKEIKEERYIEDESWNPETENEPFAFVEFGVKEEESNDEGEQIVLPDPLAIKEKECEGFANVMTYPL